MTMKKILLTAALALFSTVFTAAGQSAPITASYGDLILGFETTSGGSTNLEIDIGSYASLASFSSINLSSDLSGVFGTNFANTVSYGVYGVYAVAGATHWTDVYLTAPSGQPTFGVLGHGNTSAFDDYTGLVDTYNLQLTNGITTPDGIAVGSAALGAWSTYLPSTSPFGVSADHNIETTIGTALNLFDKSYTPNAVNSTPYTIQVNSSGFLTVQAVPEPSAYALLGLAALLMALRVFGTRRHPISSVTTK